MMSLNAITHYMCGRPRGRAPTDFHAMMSVDAISPLQLPFFNSLILSSCLRVTQAMGPTCPVSTGFATSEGRGDDPKKRQAWSLIIFDGSRCDSGVRRYRFRLRGRCRLRRLCGNCNWQCRHTPRKWHGVWLHNRPWP